MTGVLVGGSIFLMLSLIRTVSAAVVALALSACGDCYDASLVERIAIGLSVQDSVTGASPSAVTATIQATGGPPIRASYGTDTGRGVLFTFGFSTGPGTYTVLVEASGYRRWERSGVHVPADDCGRVARMTSLTARLQPE